MNHILLNTDCYNINNPVYKGCHCAYFYKMNDFDKLLENGVRNFSYYSVNDDIQKIFDTIEEKVNKFAEKISFTVWCDYNARNTQNYLKTVTQSENKKSCGKCVKTIGIYIAQSFFQCLAALQCTAYKIVENSLSLARKHGSKYETAVNEENSFETVNTIKALPLLLHSTLRNDTKFLLYSRDSTFAVNTNVGHQTWSADVEDCLIFPNHLGEVPMQVIDTTVQFVAYVNLTKTSDVMLACNQAYDVLSKIMIDKQSLIDEKNLGLKYIISAAVGLVGYADTLKDGIVTPKDIEKLAAPLIKNSHNIFPLAGSKICATYSISEGIWTAVNPIRISSENEVILSSNFVKYIRETKQDQLVKSCKQDSRLCLLTVDNEKRQLLINLANEFMIEKQRDYRKYFFSTPLELQQDVIQTIQHCFYTTVPMSLYILPLDFKYIENHSNFVKCLHKIVIRNAAKMCPVLLPEIRTSEAVLSEARKRRLNNKHFLQRPISIPCLTLKRKYGDKDAIYDSFVFAGIDFLKGVRAALYEIQNSSTPVSSFVIKCIENLIANKVEHIDS